MRIFRRFFFFIIGFCLFLGSVTDLIPKAHASSTLTTSESCIEFIKAVEGFSPQPYYDYSQYTVGYGTKCPDDKYDAYKAGGISKQEAEELLRQELTRIEDAINQRLIDKHNLAFSQHQFDALVSFSFNIGTNWLTYNSSLRSAILSNANENDMVYAFGLYCTAGGKYLPGLVSRRLCEANMYLNGVYSQTFSNDYGYVYYDANGGTVTYRVQAYVCKNNTVPASDPTRNEDVFLGWYTDLTGGTQVSTLNATLTGKTLFARWQSSENTENQSSTSTTVKVTGDVVNIRSGPGTGYGIVRQARRNESLTVSHVTHLTNMKWGKVDNGWICLDYTNYDDVISGSDHSDIDNSSKPSDEAAIPDNDSVQNDTGTDIDASEEHQNRILGTVNVNDFLRIRSGPGTTYSTVGYLLKNDKVEIFDQKAIGTTFWGRVERGWICMDYIVTDQSPSDDTTVSEEVPGQENPPAEEEPEAPNNTEATSIKGRITADALRIRSGAGTTASIVGYYYQNDVVHVSEKVLVGSSYWGKTNRGWISMDYVSPETSIEESNAPSGDDVKTVHADCLRIRKEAGTDQKIVGFLYDGDTVTILETKNVNGTAWGKVNKGWICMDYVN